MYLRLLRWIDGRLWNYSASLQRGSWGRRLLHPLAFRFGFYVFNLYERKGKDYELD